MKVITSLTVILKHKDIVKERKLELYTVAQLVFNRDFNFTKFEENAICLKFCAVLHICPIF